MFKLLVVDDEPEMACGLAYEIDWTDTKVTEVFKAYSAQQALDILKKTRIDIVVTDIGMLGMNGLEMANMIRMEWPFSKIIFVSGYDDFEYAQRAIELGVIGYIVKPVAYDEVKELVKQAIKEMEGELEKAKLLETAEKQLQEILPVMQERYLNSWIVLGKTNPNIDTDKLKLCKLSIYKDRPAFLIAIRVDEVSKDNALDLNGALEVELNNICREVLLKNKTGIIFRDLNDNQVVLVHMEEEQSLKGALRYVEGMAESFQHSVKRLLGCVVSIFWGKILPLEMMFQSYTELSERMHRRFTSSPGVIMGPDMFRSNSYMDDIKFLYEAPAISTLIDGLQESKVIERIESVFENMGLGEEESSAKLLEVYNVISGALIQASKKKGMEISKWAGSYEKDFYSIENIKSKRELRRWCSEVVKKYADYMAKQEQRQTHNLIEQAKMSIRDNLNKELSLTEIASYLYIHPNYLSRLFKEREGISMSEYIIKLRVSKAKEYLEQPGMKVYEASEKVGYESVAFFNRIFKRETGMSPKEYQASVSHTEI